MNPQYSWNIVAVFCKPIVGQYRDYVHSITFECVGTDGDFTATYLSNVSFDIDPEHPPFIEYENVTKAQLIDWVINALGPQESTYIQLSIAEDLDRQKNPISVSVAIPTE